MCTSVGSGIDRSLFFLILYVYCWDRSRIVQILYSRGEHCSSAWR